MSETTTVTIGLFSRWDATKILFSAEIDISIDPIFRVKAALELAVSKAANLEDANLKGADLKGAYLEGAHLRGAYLRDANLEDANLKGVDLKGAYLEGASLIGACLQGASLRGANLRDAYLMGASLQGASLDGAHLQDANLMDLGQRSDGYQFYAQITEGSIKIKAGCRYFTMAEARTHWSFTRANTPLGEETMAILDHAERLVAIRFPKQPTTGN